MIEPSGRILRSDDVELDGQYHLGLLPGESEASGPESVDTVTRAPQARIVENNTGHVVIEVTCSCGARVCVKCEYSDAEISENS